MVSINNVSEIDRSHLRSRRHLNEDLDIVIQQVELNEEDVVVVRKESNQSHNMKAENDHGVDVFREELISHHAATTSLQTEPPQVLTQGISADHARDHGVDVFREELMSHHAATKSLHTEPPHALTQGISADNPQRSNAHILGSVFGVVSVILMVLFLLFFSKSWRRQQKKKKKKMSRDVYGYLLRFDIEDVVLRRSTLGGWHAAYKNRLAEGDDNTVSTHDSDRNKTGESSSSDMESDEDETSMLLEEADPVVANEDMYLAADDGVFSPL
jgi:hypothetical protein